MSNEAVIINVAGVTAVRRTCAAGTSISKGTLLALSDANLVYASSGVGEAFGGIAAHDKDGADGSTSIGTYMEGVFDLTNSSVVIAAAGAMVIMSGANIIAAARASDLLSGGVIGKIEEQASANEVVRVRLLGY